MEAMATNLSRNAVESSRQRSDSPALQRMVDEEAAIIVWGTTCKMESVAVNRWPIATKPNISEQKYLFFDFLLIQTSNHMQRFWSEEKKTLNLFFFVDKVWNFLLPKKKVGNFKQHAKTCEGRKK